MTSFNGEKVAFAYSAVPFTMLTWSPGTGESREFDVRRRSYTVLISPSSLPIELRAIPDISGGPTLHARPCSEGFINVTSNHPSGTPRQELLSQ